VVRNDEMARARAVLALFRWTSAGAHALRLLRQSAQRSPPQEHRARHCKEPNPHRTHQVRTQWPRRTVMEANSDPCETFAMTRTSRPRTLSDVTGRT